MDSSMILFNADAEFSGEEADEPGKVVGWRGYQQRAADFLQQNYNNTLGIDCSNNNFQQEKWDKKEDDKVESFCRFDPEAELGPCGTGNMGYDEGKPCVFLKLNKIFGLNPEYYNDPNDLPNSPETKTVFPKSLKDQLNTIPNAQDKKQVSALNVHVNF